MLDVIFKEDQSRLRRDQGAQNMALVRRLAFNMVRAGKGKRSIKTAQKAARWKTNNLKAILTKTINLDSLPWRSRPGTCPEIGSG